MIRVFASLSLTLLIALYFGTNNLKFETREARKELRELDRAIDREKEAINVLSAEWSHLTRPGNLRKLAEAHLGLDVVRAEQIAAMEDVPWLGFNLFDDNLEAIPVRLPPRHTSPLQRSPASDRRGPAPGVSYVSLASLDDTRAKGWSH